MRDDASRVELQLQTAPVKAVVLVFIRDNEEVFRYMYSADEAWAIAGHLLSFAEELDPLLIDPNRKLCSTSAGSAWPAPSRPRRGQ